MVNVLRRFSQPIMVVITVLVIVSFMYWGPSFTRSGSGERDVMSLYGRGYSLEAFHRQAKKLQVFTALFERGRMMGGEYMQAVPGSWMLALGRDSNNSLLPIVENAVVFEHEADALGITSTPEERREQFERTLKFMDHQGKFDPALVKEFIDKELSPRGFSESDLDSIFLHGEVRARKLRTLVGSTVAATPEEVRDKVVAQRLSTEASYVALTSEEFRKDLKVTDEELLTYYNAHLANYKTLEKRRVRYAAFRVPEPNDGKPRDSSENSELLQKVADKAWDFAQKLAAPGSDFDAIAKELGAEIGETKNAFPKDQPPDEIEIDNDALGEAIFKLTPEHPYSEHLTEAQGMKKGAYVLKLVETKQPEQRPLADVKTDVEAMVIGNRANDLAKAKANDVHPKLEEAKKAGKTFSEAAESLGLKAVAHPPIGGAQRPGKDPYTSTVRTEAEKLAPGQMSQPVSAQGAWVIVHVDYRPPVDEKIIEQTRPMLVHRIEEGQGPMNPGLRDMIYERWFDERRKAADKGK